MVSWIPEFELALVARIIVALIADLALVSIMMLSIWTIKQLAYLLKMETNLAVKLLMNFSHAFYLALYLSIAIFLILIIIIDALSESSILDTLLKLDGALNHV